MGFSQTWSGTPFDMLSQSMFSLLLVEPLAISGLVVLAVSAPLALDTSFPPMVAAARAFLAAAMTALLPQAEWARGLLMAPLVPFALLGEMAKPFMQSYGSLVALGQLYSIPVFLWLHNWHELRMEAQEERRQTGAANPAPESVRPEVVFHAVR